MVLIVPPDCLSISPAQAIRAGLRGCAGGTHDDIFSVTVLSCAKACAAAQSIAAIASTVRRRHQSTMGFGCSNGTDQVPRLVDQSGGLYGPDSLQVPCWPSPDAPAVTRQRSSGSVAQ